jgi:SRSO17 transposase
LRKKLDSELRLHVASYGHLLRSGTRFYAERGYQYICGLFQSGKRNIEKMSEQVPSVNLQQMHHFISESPWDWEPLLDQLNRDVFHGYLPIKHPIGFLIDESGWAKQGTHSVGVGRQYLGSLGKVDNGQVAVLASLCQGKDNLLVDTKLYLPKSWTTDAERCDKAGIPAADRVFKSKPELAQDLVARAWSRGLEFDWVGGDGAYGHDSKFRHWLDDKGQFYVLDVHQDQLVYMENPCPEVPASGAGRGRKPLRLKAQRPAVKVESIFAQIAPEQWTVSAFRTGSKGNMKRKVWTTEVYTWDGEEANARKVTLIISAQPNGANLKYSVANNDLGKCNQRELLYRQMQRFWVEQSIKEAKSELGMHQYQVRGWKAWHHHMALTIMALSFMLKTRKVYREEIPLLTCNDIRYILVQMLPRKATSDEIAWAIIQQRHKRRQADIDRYQSKN